MGTIIKLGWRNIWRHKQRSIVVIISIAVGIFGSLAPMALINSGITQGFDKTISNSLGHIAVHKKGYQDKGSLDLNFYPDKFMIKNISDETSMYTPKVRIQGIVSFKGKVRNITINGIDPEKEKTVSSIHKYTSDKDGSRYLDDPDGNFILISKFISKKLGCSIGDRIDLIFQGKNKKSVNESLVVRGIFESPYEQLDKFVVFAGIKKLQKISGLGENISEITIILKDKDLADPVKRNLISKINDTNLEILTWKNMAPGMVYLVVVVDSAMYLLMITVFIPIIFSVANVLLMSILERFHEIGVMKAIGTRPSKIYFMVMFESINLSLIGLAAGLAVILPVIGFLSINGLDLGLFSETLRSNNTGPFGSGRILYLYLKSSDISTACVIVLISSVVAAMSAARKAAKIKPLDAINFI